MYSKRKPFTRPTKNEPVGPQKVETKKKGRKAAEPVEVDQTSEVEFKPDARDGDGDGMVQDGTIWERPVGSDEIPDIMVSEADEA